MKLNTMKPAELEVLAEVFAVDLDPGLNKQQILARFTEDGISQKMVDEYYVAKEKAVADAEAREAAAELAEAERAKAELKAIAEAEKARQEANTRNVVTTKNIVNESLVEEPVVEDDVAEAVIAEARKRTTLQRASKTQVLMFMDRENQSYAVRGYKFTQKHPFVLVDPDDAEFIAENVDGFRYATPKEAREFYS